MSIPTSAGGNRTGFSVVGTNFTRDVGKFHSTLTLLPVTLNDAGVYICWAADTRGYFTTQAVLNVIPGQSSHTLAMILFGVIHFVNIIWQ